MENVNEIIQFLKGFNLQTLLGMAFMLWLFSKHFDAKFAEQSKSIQEQGNRLDAQGKRIDRLYEMFVDLRKEFHEEMRDFRKKVIE